MLKACGIYTIENLVTGKVYVGSAINFKSRWASHISKLNFGKHPNQKLQNAWKKYDRAVFKFSILELVFLRELLLEREQYWIDVLQSSSRTGYNILPTAGSSTGRILSPATREKISISNKGRRTQLGRIRSLETRAKLSSIAKNRSPSHWRASVGKMILSNVGRVRSAETRAKMSRSAMGHSPTRTGPHTPESINKMSEARKNWYIKAQLKSGL